MSRIYINSHGDKFWHSERDEFQLHRLEGPAIEWTDGNLDFYIDGI